MKCSQVMTRDPVSCFPADTVEKAAQLMKERGVGPIPVVHDQTEQHLIGILTDRDVAIKVVGEVRDPKRTRVDEVMTRDPVTCQPDDDLEQTIRLMTKHRVRRVPVVDSQRRLVGIIAQADVAMNLAESDKTGILLRELSRP